MEYDLLPPRIQDIARCFFKTRSVRGGCSQASSARTENQKPNIVTSWHTKTLTDTLSELHSDATCGLDNQQIAERQVQHGYNEIVDRGGRSLWLIVWEQISGAMVLLLVVAAVASFMLGELTDAVVILAIVVLNAALGFVQDYRAEKSLAALKRLAVPQVRVRRNGKVRELSARELVPGDIVLLEVGNFVPADGRLIEAINLAIEEATLTGESEPVRKQTAPLDKVGTGEAALPLGDRTNMAYMGTVVTYGHGQLVITDTGMQSELGNIASSLQSVAAEATPLQKRLAQLGKSLALVAIAIVTLVFGLGWLRGEEPKLLMMTALSLAVAVVPEGLPAVATVALALGARRLFLRHALIRKLPAVETLGSVTVICSDKTGTLTENRMTVTVLDVASGRLDVAAGGERGDGLDSESRATMALLLAGAGLCNDAQLERADDDDTYLAVGDPTETALALVAARLGYPQDQVLARLPRVSELPFDSDRKRMTTVHRVQLEEGAEASSPSVVELVELISHFNSPYIAFTKGGVDSLMETCQFAWEEGRSQPLNEELRTRIARANASLASHGMRVLGVAMRLLTDEEYNRATAVDLNHQSADEQTDNAVCNQADVEHDEIFVGMLGMIDPPRQEAVEAVDRCRRAGIRPVMITGDHPLTAQHIAGKLGFSNHSRVVTGADLETLNSADLAETVKSTSVYARVSPKHKLRLVQALQANGQVVAMTGDGVNDAPALKQAHIGVAMGITGTDVSKEASQMVLLDDNFATIVGAVEQGRVVYDNIRKFVKYTMTSNAGEIWVMVLGPLLGMPLPLLPLQILWINLVTDGLPGLALAVEKAERDTMQRDPYPPEQHIFGAGMGRDIAWIGLLMGVVSLALGYAYWARGAEATHWRTLVFTVLTLAQMGNALAIRSSRDSLFSIGIFSNLALLGSVLLTFVLQLAVIYWAPLQSIFKTSSLSLVELLACIAISSVVFWAVELQKLVCRRRSPA